jgi:hypothetical protein
MADQNETEARLKHLGDRAYELAAQGVFISVGIATTVGGAAIGGYTGYRLGEAVSPDDFVGLGMAWMYTVEGVPAAIGGLVGAVAGICTGAWIIEGDFDSCT